MGVVSKNRIDVFREAAQGPISQRHSMLYGRDPERVAQEGSGPLRGYESHLQNFQDILRTGHVRENTVNDRGVSEGWENMRMDLNADDSFARSVRQARDNVRERMSNDPDMQRLMQQENWGRAERVQYERRLSQLTEEETSRIPGLSNYRSSIPLSGNDRLAGTPARSAQSTPNLNDLRHDIDCNSGQIRWDCSRQSAVQGAIMQMVENDIMPETATPGNMRVRSDYHRAVGVVEFAPGMSPQGGRSAGSLHAWIVSSATGNVIESTSTPDSSYHESLDPNYSFERAVRGDAFVGRDGQYYAHEGTRRGIDRARENETQAAENRRFDEFYARIPTQVAPREEWRRPLTPEAEALIELKGLAEGADALHRQGRGGRRDGLNSDDPARIRDSARQQMKDMLGGMTPDERRFTENDIFIENQRNDSQQQNQRRRNGRDLQDALDQQSYTPSGQTATIRPAF